MDINKFSVRLTRELAVHFDDVRKLARVEVVDGNTIKASRVAHTAAELHNIFVDFNPLISFSAVYEDWAIENFNRMLDAASPRDESGTP